MIEYADWTKEDSHSGRIAALSDADKAKLDAAFAADYPPAYVSLAQFTVYWRGNSKTGSAFGPYIAQRYVTACGETVATWRE